MKDKIPHKHSEVIKAWADGETIQVRVSNHSEWLPICEPSWNEDYEYRVKPKDAVLYAHVPLVKFISNGNIKDIFDISVSNKQLLASNLKLYFNESGELSKAEVIS